jgi:hypothetical protein
MRFPKHPLGCGAAKAIEKSVGTIGRHHDQIRAEIRGGLQDCVSRFAILDQAVPSPISTLGELYRRYFGGGSYMQRRNKTCG